jgi:hypothetical protein
MKRLLLVLALTAVPLGCDVHSGLRSAQRLSTEPTLWQGDPGTAVTIRFSSGTEQLEGASRVGFKFAPSKGVFWEIADFTVPVMKREPHAVTLFFSNEAGDLTVLSHLPEEIKARTLRVVPCHPDRVCP